jgi:hypothetical protein
MVVNLLKVSSSDSYRMQEGFFSGRSNLTTIATNMRFSIACLQQAGFVLASDSYWITTALLESINGRLSKYNLLLFKKDFEMHSD